MQRSVALLVGSGTLVIAGLVLMVVGTQMVLEGFSQGDGDVRAGQALTISGDLGMPGGGGEGDRVTRGVFAVQVMNELNDDQAVHATVTGPSGTRVAYSEVGQGTVEGEFDVLEAGPYRLVIENTGSGQVHVFGAIGPLPEPADSAPGIVSVYLIGAGLAGLAVVGTYEMRARRARRGSG